MKISNLEELMVEGLKDLYNAEKQISNALPKMISEAESSELKQALEENLRRTKDHVLRLEQVLRI